MPGGAPERGSGARRDRLGRIAASLPGPLQTAARLAFVAARITQGPRSFATYLRLSRIRHHTGSRGKVVRIRLRELGGRAMAIRPSTSDVDTIWGTFAGRYHRPPAEVLEREVKLIWDLGANIGLTMADLAVRHPHARIVGPGDRPRERSAGAPEHVRLVEPLRGHRGRGLAQRWPDPIRAARGGHVGALRDSERPGPTTRRWPPPTPCRRTRCWPSPDPAPPSTTSRSTSRAPRSTCCAGTRAGPSGCARSAVEVHAPYSVEECRDDLAGLGFSTRVDPRHWACVIGVRAS